MRAQAHHAQAAEHARHTGKLTRLSPDLIARRFGCYRRSEQARPFDQPLQTRYPFPDAPQLAFEHVQTLVRPGLQHEHQAAQGCAHAKDPDQLRAHAISLRQPDIVKQGDRP